MIGVELVDPDGEREPGFTGSPGAADGGVAASVVPASGRPAPHLAHRQLERLRAEGVPITDGRIRLRECRWDISV